MNKTNLFGLLAFAVALSAQSGNVSAQSTTRDRLKADKCYSKDGSKEVSCDDAKSQQAAAKYPNATRIEPAFPKTKIKKEWDALVKATMGKDSNAIISTAQTVLNHADASANEKSESANQIAQAYLQTDKTSYLQPIDYAKKAIDFNGLTNNAHYQLMGVLSQMLMAEKRYDESLLYANRYAAETGIDDMTVNKTRGNDLYRLKRYPEAAVALQKAYDLDKGADPNLATMLMDSYEKSGNKAQANKIADEVSKSATSADPNDKSAQVKQLLVLANAKQYEKAAKVFDELYAKGQITQLNEYEAGYVSYSYLDGREAQSIKIINDGIAKGIIKPDVSVYSILGQSYYYSDNPKGAIDAWGKGAAMSNKGELDLLLAQVLGEESRYAESKAAAKQALSKGIESKGNAYMLIAQAESEFGLDNKAAYTAALREAQNYPETKSQATKMLKEAGLK